MGQLTITPSYVDLSNGSTWASLGGNQGGNLDAPNKLFADLDNYGTFFVSIGTTGYCFGELDYARWPSR